MTKEFTDEEIRRQMDSYGPRWRYNDPRFSEDLPDYMMIHSFHPHRKLLDTFNKEFFK